MATSGSLSLSIAAGLTARLTWSLQGQSGMTSTIFYEVVWSYSGSKKITFSNNLYFNGQFIADGFTQFLNGNRITYGYTTVTRNLETNKGTLSFSLSSSSGDYWYDGAEYDGEHSFSSKSTSNTWTITSTTKYGSGAQIVSIADFTDEAGPLITYSYDKGTSVSSTKIEVGVALSNDGVITLPYREMSPTETSYKFNFTSSDLSSLYTLLKKGETATVHFYVRTTEIVNGEIMYINTGPFTKTFSFVNYKPVVSATLTDTNDATKALTGNPSHLVRYMSKVAYDMDVTLRKGALDVIGCYIQNGGRIEEGFTSGTFENPTTNIFYFSATDDRGYTGTASKSLSLFDGEFINYIKLSSSVKSTPISPEGNVSVTITGKYFNANFGVAQNKLDMQYTIYKKGTTPVWSEKQTITPVMIDNETYTYTFSDGGLDYTAQYVVAIKVNDLLMSSESSVSVVAKPVFYWNNDEFIFNVPVTFIEGLSGGSSLFEDGTATGYYMNSNSQTTSGGFTWYYRKWDDGLLECWCTVPITTTVNTAWGNMYVAAISSVYKTDLCYPVQPIGTPVIIATIGAGNVRGMLIADNSYAADTISTGRYNIASPVSITSSSTFRINYYVRGRWK